MSSAACCGSYVALHGLLPVVSPNFSDRIKKKKKKGFHRDFPISICCTLYYRKVSSFLRFIDLDLKEP